MGQQSTTTPAVPIRASRWATAVDDIEQGVCQATVMADRGYVKDADGHWVPAGD